METMTLQPTAAISARRRARSSYVHVPEIFGAVPSMAAAGHVCTWSSTTNGTVIRLAAKATKAHGARRLGEHST